MDTMGTLDIFRRVFRSRERVIEEAHLGRDIVSKLTSNRPADRITAIWKIAQSRPEQAPLYLIPRLRDTDETIQIAAANALGHLRCREATASLIESFHGQTYPLNAGDGSPWKYYA